MAYIETTHEPKPECIFCAFPEEGPDRDEANLILVRSDLAYVILNKFPYNTGHLIVVPFLHEANYRNLPAEVHAEISLLTARSIEALEQAYSPDGFNVGINMGRAGGAGIPDHMHQHIVPRWAGDANFFSTVGETKVLPESLEDTFTKLKPLL